MNNASVGCDHHDFAMRVEAPSIKANSDWLKQKSNVIKEEAPPWQIQRIRSSTYLS